MLKQTLWVGGGLLPRQPLTRTRSDAGLFDVHRVEVGDDVGVVVRGSRDFVQQLRLHGADRHEAAGARVFGDREAAVGFEFGDRIADIVKARHFFEERIVAAAALRTALDDVARRQRAGQCVVVIAPPVELPRGGTDHDRGVGDARTDHDVGALIERFLDAPAAEVDVGRQRLLARSSERFLRVEIGERLSAPLQVGEIVEQIVAVDVRHFCGELELREDFFDLRRHAFGIEAAGVGDDLDASFEARRGNVLDLFQKRPHVTHVGAALLALAVQNRHRQFGEIVPGQHIDRSAFDHLARGGEAVTVITAAVCDSNDLAHGCPPF